MKILVNYADREYAKSQQRNSISGKEIGGFDKVLSYGPDDIEPEFFNKNQHIFKALRGAGYWLWKPYIINKTLERMEFGDYLFYCDSGAEFIHNIDPLVEIAKNRK